jgi:secreted trypsin-like serine protease
VPKLTITCFVVLRAEGQSNKGLDNNIIGPGEAPQGAFPWMTALLIDGRSFCGGSLIDQYHIVTAVILSMIYL